MPISIDISSKSSRMMRSAVLFAANERMSPARGFSFILQLVGIIPAICIRHTSCHTLTPAQGLTHPTSQTPSCMALSPVSAEVQSPALSAVVACQCPALAPIFVYDLHSSFEKRMAAVDALQDQRDFARHLAGLTEEQVFFRQGECDERTHGTCRPS